MKKAEMNQNEMPLPNRKIFNLVAERTAGNVSAFADIIGIKQQSLDRLFKIDKRSGKYPSVSPDIKRALKEKLGINEIYLLTSDDTTQPNTDLGGKVPTQKGNEARLTKEQTKGAVPFYGDLPVSAGQNDLAKMLDNMKPTGWLKMDNMPSSIGTFPVIGCSMEPDIKQGDFISITPVDRWEKIYPDNIYMIITRDDRMIKHLAIDENDDEILWCISPNYPKFKIEKSEILQLYRVVFHGRFA